MRRISALGALGACVLIQVVLTVLVMDRGFLAFGDDDFSKLHTAVKWATHPTFAPSPVWLPLEFWLPGGLYAVVGDVYAASLALNLGCSLGCLFVLFSLARRIEELSAARWSVLLLAVFPWHLWTGISAQTESVYQLGFLSVAYLLVRWREEQRSGLLYGAALACAMLTGLRYQGWILAALVTGYLLFQTLRRRAWPPRARTLVLALTVVWAFPMLWSGYSWYTRGSPFAWWSLTWEEYFVPLPLGLRLVRYPAYLFLIAPLLCPLFLIGARSFRSLSRSQRLAYGLFGCGYFVALVVYAAGSNGSLYVEQRYVVPPLLVLLPFAVRTLRRLAPRRICFYGLLSLLLLWQVLSCLRFPAGYRIEAFLADRLTRAWSAGALGNDAQVMIDVHNPTAIPRLLNVSAVAVLASRVGQVAPAPPGFADAVLSGSPPFDSRAAFTAAGGRPVTIFTNNLAVSEVLAASWSSQGDLLGYHVFSAPGAPPFPESAAPPFESAVRVRWQNGVELLGVTTPAAAFPRQLIARWRGLAAGGFVRWDFVPEDSAAPALSLEVSLGGPAPPRPPWLARDSYQQVNFGHLIKDEGAGRYTIFATVLDEQRRPVRPSLAADSGAEPLRVQVMSVDLVYAKRPFLRDLVVGREQNLRLGLRIILSLVN